MTVVVPAGGRGTRLAEETVTVPKPTAGIGGRPILWPIMRLCAHFGVADFIVCLGYNGGVIKQYLANHALNRSDVTVDLGANRIEYDQRARRDPWVALAGTGDATGGRPRRIAPWLPPDEPFGTTCGDGPGDIDIARSMGFRRQHGRLAVVAAVRPPPRFGGSRLDGSVVTRFSDAPIDGGFVVRQPAVLDLIADDTTSFEREPLRGLAQDGQLGAFTHDGFRQPMDTPGAKIPLDAPRDAGKAPGKLWE